jgi:hypothetical protein
MNREPTSAKYVGESPSANEKIMRIVTPTNATRRRPNLSSMNPVAYDTVSRPAPPMVMTSPASARLSCNCIASSGITGTAAPSPTLHENATMFRPHTTRRLEICGALLGNCGLAI